MKILPGYFILIFLLVLTKESTAQIQEAKFNPFTGTDGIILGKINGMTRDKYGFMWFSDESNRCIIRFDGSNMTRYQYQDDPQKTNSLGGYYPECLFADSSGNIWIGFKGMGLDKFDPVIDSFTHYRHHKNDPESLSDDVVSAVLVDHLGNIWVGDNGGLDLLDEKTGKFKHYHNKANDPSSLSYNIVRSLYEDKAGVLWIGTGYAFYNDDKGGLNRFNRSTGTFTRYMSDPKNPQTLINNKVRAIFEDSYGTFWVGTNGDGLHTMDRKTGLFTRHTYDPAKPGKLSRTPVKDYNDHITFIIEDADKKIWIGTLWNGLIRYDPVSKKITHYGSNDDKEKVLKDSTSWWANATPDGLIWFSSENKNLFRIDIYNSIIPHYGKSANDAVFGFSEETPSVCWYGTASGLVRKDFNNGTIRRYVNEPANPNSLSNNTVFSILKDKLGDFWIGTNNGLNHFDLKTKKFTRYYPDSNKTALPILNLYEDGDSNIWVGTFGKGLYMLHPASGKLTSYKNNPADVNSINNDFISAIIEDGADLWVGNINSGGLNKLNRHTGKFVHYLPGLFRCNIYRDAGGIIWIGTPSGLFRYDKKSDSFNSPADENSGKNIVQVLAITGDKEDNLWISTETGIYMLNKKRDQVIRFGKENGIPDANASFIDGSSFTRRDGELNFGDASGYYAFYPDKLKISAISTQLYFTGFWLGNKEIIPGKTGPLQTSLYDIKEIRLNHDQNIFSFSATFIDFRHPADKQIYYQLENYDQGWRTCKPEERLQYFKVPPGKYIFRIKIANSSNGEWIEKSINVIVSPPWWTTWWAYCMYGLLLIGMVFIIYRFTRQRIIQKEREKARAKELAQAKEIEKAYHKLEQAHESLKSTQAQLIQSEKMASLGELTAGIAHEIQNPLNFVNNFSEVNNELIEELKMKNEKLKIENNEVNELLGDIYQNNEKISMHGKRAYAIVKGMLQHSRTTSGQKELTDINALCDEYLRLAYHGLRAKDKTFNAEIKTDFDNSIEKINIIPQDIGRVILNLINNAFYAVNERRKAEGAGYEPTIAISTASIQPPAGTDGGRSVQIKVSDNGGGIPPKILDKIFQPFFTTKPTGQGTGLGLSLAYDIVKAHGGEIKVKTIEGEGSELIIQLPEK